MIRALVGLFLWMTVSACSWLPHAFQSGSNDSQVLTNDFIRSRLVVGDLVGGLVQIPSLDPQHTTLHTKRPTSRFAEILISGLQEAGYDLRIGDAQSPSWLSYSIAPASIAEMSSAQGDTYTFILSVGMVKLKRSYRVDVQGVQPASSMFIHGADASKIRISDQLLSMKSESSVKPFAVVAAPAPENSEAPALTTSTNIKRNLYETRQSNYESILAQYGTVRKEILVFPNDSLIMGTANKRLAREIASAFDSRTDVISIVGCSHGRTQIVNGNEVLAQGRAYRVKEEFLLAGIAADKIMEEGCWAGVYFDEVMPRRGVVLTHKRR